MILLIIFCSILKVFDLLKNLLKWWKSFVPEGSTYNY